MNTIKISKSNDCTGKDEWYCNFYKCPNCKGVEDGFESSNITRSFDYCPNCGYKLEWEI